MSKMFNLEEEEKQFGDFAMVSDDLPGTGYKAMIYCQYDDLIWCITATNVRSCMKSPNYGDISEETHVIQYRLSKESMSVYIDGVGQGVVLYDDIPGMESFHDGEGYYNVDNIIVPDFWDGRLKQILCLCINTHSKVLYDYSHKNHAL